MKRNAPCSEEAPPCKASGVGEILAAAEFYDFDAKYNNAESRTVTDPKLPGGAAERIPEDREEDLSGGGRIRPVTG